ncbi:hypothetical protein L207DRAFT_261797 [Hyaloscypha variabilis F]|uniref:Uncharacterized protein n=1 Tax=Hyaloscypha variabilis (strain UAMH 11265 / GT02V1 / F) TaxID=1149755 RepID=A0A2J6QSL9_HYAVF|nr:hypothetical protein L207DRAFT_261797 [Hyaloscypha variabilis F]
MLQGTDQSATSVQGSYSMNTLTPNRSPSSYTNIDSVSSSSQTVPALAAANRSALGPTPHLVNHDWAHTGTHLEICINKSQYTKTLCEIDLRDINSDGELFAKIKNEYFSRRKPSSSLYLRKPTGIDFVKFALEDRNSVSILQKPQSIPPPEEVTSGRYTYSPCPLGDDRPMEADKFLHYLYCGAEKPSLAWLPRLPKKSDPSIFRFVHPINEGWGIHITEGTNWFTVSLLNLFMMIMSGVAAGLWKLYMDDFQGAFGFAGWIVGVVNAVLLVYIAKWNRS